MVFWSFFTCDCLTMKIVPENSLKNSRMFCHDRSLHHAGAAAAALAERRALAAAPVHHGRATQPASRRTPRRAACSALSCTTGRRATTPAPSHTPDLQIHRRCLFFVSVCTGWLGVRVRVKREQKLLVDGSFVPGREEPTYE